MGGTIGTMPVSPGERDPYEVIKNHDEKRPGFSGRAVGGQGDTVFRALYRPRLPPHTPKHALIRAKHARIRGKTGFFRRMELQLIALFLWPYFWGVVLPYVGSGRMRIGGSGGHSEDFTTEEDIHRGYRSGHVETHYSGPCTGPDYSPNCQNTHSSMQNTQEFGQKLNFSVGGKCS